MTVLVGVLCKDGVVIGSDSAATFAHGDQVRTIEQKTKKIDIVGGGVIVAGTGEIGLGQRFHAIVEKAWTDNLFGKPPIEIGKALSATAIQDFRSTAAPQAFCALVAFPCKRKPYLLDLGAPSFQPELKTERIWYVSMGSGQPIADPFLGFIREAFWHDGIPSVQDAVFAVTWTLSQAISLNPGGVNGPMQIAVLTNAGDKMTARELTDDEIAEHAENVSGAVSHLREYRDKLRGQGAAAPPDPPQPAG